MEVVIFFAVCIGIISGVVGILCFVNREERIGILSLILTVICIVATALSATPLHKEKEQLHNDFVNDEVLSIQKVDNDEFVVMSKSGMYFLSERELLKINN